MVQWVLDKHIDNGSPGDIALFGHSLGAIISYELSSLLFRRGSRVPLHLFVAGSAAPHRPRPDSRQEQRDGAALLARLRRLGGFNEGDADNAELIDALLPVLRADIRAADRYHYIGSTRSRVPITVFHGRHDPSLSADDASSWSTHSEDTLVLTMEGGHFFLQQNKAEIIAIIDQRVSLTFEQSRRNSQTDPCGVPDVR